MLAGLEAFELRLADGGAPGNWLDCAPSAAGKVAIPSPRSFRKFLRLGYSILLCSFVLSQHRKFGEAIGVGLKKRIWTC